VLLTVKSISYKRTISQIYIFICINVACHLSYVTAMVLSSLPAANSSLRADCGSRQFGRWKIHIFTNVDVCQCSPRMVGFCRHRILELLPT